MVRGHHERAGHSSIEARGLQTIVYTVLNAEGDTLSACVPLRSATSNRTHRQSCVHSFDDAVLDQDICQLLAFGIYNYPALQGVPCSRMGIRRVETVKRVTLIRMSLASTCEARSAKQQMASIVQTRTWYAACMALRQLKRCSGFASSEWICCDKSLLPSKVANRLLHASSSSSGTLLLGRKLPLPTRIRVFVRSSAFLLRARERPSCAFSLNSRSRV